jgi:hypothetical protein
VQIAHREERSDPRPQTSPPQQGGQKSLLKSISESATLDRAIMHTFFDNTKSIHPALEIEASSGSRCAPSGNFGREELLSITPGESFGQLRTSTRMRVMKLQTQPVRVIRAFPPDIGILQRKTRFHPVRARFDNQQPATTQRLTQTALQTPNFQYSINPERHDRLLPPFQNSLPKLHFNA